MPAKKRTLRAPRASGAGEKLAEALILRADYQKRLEQVKNRLLRNAKVQEGDTPAEDPRALLTQMEQIAADLQQIIQRINQTNATTELERGKTIADAIAERDVLRLRHSVYRALAEAATVTQDRYTKSEVKFKSSVDVTKMQKLADECAQKHRELDARIQELNWSTKLRK